MDCRRALPAAALTILFSCATPSQQGAQKTSMNEVIFLGTIAAGPEQTPHKNWAIYTTDDIIREVGPADDIRRAHPAARVIDASDATILPGLTDAHGHLYGLGLSLDTVNLVDTASYDEVITRVKERAATTSEGDWVLGRGWDQNDWADTRFPTKQALDAAVPDHPVWLRRIDGHTGLANSAAMRIASLTAATSDPAGGRILRDARGEPTGVFVDTAMNLIDSKVPPPSFALRKKRVFAAARRIAENGLTEVHDAGADDETIRAVRELIDEKQFPIRVYMMLSDSGRSLDDAGSASLRNWLRTGPLIGYGRKLTVRSIKVYADGALGSRGAALLASYNDDPGNVGLLISTPQHMTEVAQRAIAGGFQVNTHAIGDRGVRNVIDAYEAAGVKPQHRFRIEHLQVTAPSDFPRLARDGIIASMQPTHATSDMYWAEARLGPERVKGAYAWRTVLNSGGRLALGSDFPVEAVNPLFGIYAGVTRQDQKGWPAAGWFPDQKLTLPEAIRGFTIDAAYAAFEEGSRGTIEPGRLADFTIIDGDLYAMPQSELFKAKVRYTVVGGEIVYKRGLQ